MVNNHVPAMEALLSNGAQYNFADNVRSLVDPLETDTHHNHSMPLFHRAIAPDH